MYIFFCHLSLLYLLICVSQMFTISMHFCWHARQKHFLKRTLHSKPFDSGLTSSICLVPGNLFLSFFPWILIVSLLACLHKDAVALIGWGVTTPRGTLTSDRVGEGQLGSVSSFMLELRLMLTSKMARANFYFQGREVFGGTSPQFTITSCYLYSLQDFAIPMEVKLCLVTFKSVY